MSDVRDTSWPQPKFAFSVEIADVGVVSFQEVTGLDVDQAVIEYRKPKSPGFAPSRMPGIAKYGNVTLKRGVFVKDNAFFDWYAAIRNSRTKRTTVTITLLDEQGRPTMVWTLKNAFPTKITAADLNAAGNEVAVDTLEIAHEGLSLSSN